MTRGSRKLCHEEKKHNGQAFYEQSYRSHDLSRSSNIKGTIEQGETLDHFFRWSKKRKGTATVREKGVLLKGNELDSAEAHSDIPGEGVGVHLRFATCWQTRWRGSERGEFRGKGEDRRWGLIGKFDDKGKSKEVSMLGSQVVVCERWVGG